MVAEAYEYWVIGVLMPDNAHVRLAMSGTLEEAKAKLETWYSTYSGTYPQMYLVRVVRLGLAKGVKRGTKTPDRSK